LKFSGSDWSDSASATPIIGKGGKFLMDHEYHEISDEESVAESPRFEVYELKNQLNLNT